MPSSEQTPINPNIRTVIDTPIRGGETVTEQPTPDPDAQPEKPKKSHRNLFIGLGAGAALVASAVVGVNALNAGPDRTPTHSAGSGETPTPTPSETAAPTEVLTVKSLEVLSGGTPEQLGTTFLQDRLSAWEMVGATPESQKAYFTSGGSFDFITSLADKNGDIFADALLVPNWRDIPALATWVSNLKKLNANSLENWFKTYHSGSAQDVEAFTSSVTVDSTAVISRDASHVTLKTTATEHNNADKNRVGSVLNPEALAINGSQFAYQYTLQTIDGTERISALATALLK